jgi:nudix-type nucleoside diphosphatase (YffH/AdpP family)
MKAPCNRTEIEAMPHDIIALEQVHDGWTKLFVATVRLPDGTTMKREIEDHGQAVMVLPYDPQRRTAMVIRQFRAPPFHVAGQEVTLEAPAGILDEDDPQACARREAMEEIGLRLSTLEPVAVVWGMPGISTERAHLFLAPYSEADRVGEGGGLDEEHEDIEVCERALDDLASEADRGGLTDLKLLVLVQTLRLRRPDLFR